MNNKKSVLYVYLFKALLVFIAVAASYFVVTDYYAKRQEELAFNSAENAMNYLSDLLKEQGEITVVGEFMFAGETLLNNNPDRIDEFHRHTGFGYTIFSENVRINTSAKAKGADKVALGTTANKEITQKVLKKGETFKGVTNSLGKDWLIIHKPLYDGNKRIVGMTAVFLEYNTFIASLIKFKIMVALVALFFVVFVQGLLFQTYHGSKKLRFTRNEMLKKNETLVLQKVELEKSQSNFKQISNTIDDVFYLYNISFKKYEYISPNCKKVLGVNQEMFYLGGGLQGPSLHKEDKALFKEATIKVDNGESYDIEYRIIINGKIRWIREQSFPIKDSEGTTIKNSGICSDITEKKYIDKQLQLSYDSTKKLSKIGVEITENLSVVEIVEHVYQKITQLMDATSFAIGIIKKNELIFPLFIDGDKRYENVVYSLDDNILATICAHKNLDIIIDDIEEDYQKYTNDPLTVTKGENPISVIYLPLKFKGKVIGVITVQSFTKKAYSENQIDLLRNLSIFIANALENAQLNESLEEKVEIRTKEVVLQKTMLEKSYANAKILAQIGLDISLSLKFDENFDKLHQNVNKLLDAEVFGVRIYNREENIIEYRYDIESGVQDGVIEVPFSDKNNYTVWCIENNKEILINDNEKEYKNYVNEIKVLSGKMPHSLIFCPMVIGSTVLGAITVQSFEKNAYTESDMDIIRTLSFYTGIALANAKLYETLEFKVATRTLELSRKNKEITDSINYAKRIQDAMLTNKEDRVKLLPNSFVFYRPKDTLSGDFYRIDEIKTKKGDELVFFAVGDCTGHGVPGASLAMLCNSILKHSTTNLNVNSPGEALDYAKEQLGLFFHSSDEIMIDDGMDVAFCTLNKKTKMLYFAGANSNCIIVRKKEVIILKGDRRHVGHQEDDTLFTSHTFKLEKNDCIYLTSDGIIDQFGGSNNRKFMRKRFFELLQREHSNSMKIQGENIKKEFENWKGDIEQTDDVCVIGVRIT